MMKNYYLWWNSVYSNGILLRSLWSSRFTVGLSTTKVASDNTQAEISKRPRENRCVINAPRARKLFHCQLPADGSQPPSRFAETNRCITYLPYPEKSTAFRVARRLVARREEREKKGWSRVENVSKVSLSEGKREKVVGILPSGADSLDIYTDIYKRTNTYW